MNFGGINPAILQMAPYVLVLGLGYWLMIRPQQLKAKELKAQIAGVKRGDRVITAGGIIGTIAKVRDGVGEVEVDIAPNVRVVVLRETLTSVLAPVAANDAKAA